ncbi:peroxiredoxin type-2 [Coemansia sp. BCRC 34490]|nr:peroxiredoxin type-2 [Coemansia sp. Benny D160-2]KAJ2509904.1 peroxiredoxin type-2 [Coemansia sp. RSA 1939]KAJ2524610.1 peroxiredoxin type-2 [Coemansia sp. RSA 2049]KAJ2595292.1 peroxiredoxin type-2 [Coemansia sp. RSA 1804]KAJ2682289.1 peroxiredoxin type-2 [Coemansia sp. RSA 1285]KAJ2757396.1 peroxiredoxin type-2 [Coemansia sp. BCRC 34490]
MAIKIGDIFPDTVLTYVPYDAKNPEACGLPQQLKTHEAFRGKKVVLFAVPGAFTPTCSEEHMPGYVRLAGDMKSKGADIVACVASNDQFVMHAWGKSYSVKDDILMLSDANGELGSALGLVNDGSARRMGPIRLARFALIIDDLKVIYVGIEPAPGVSVSGAPAVLAKL